MRPELPPTLGAKADPNRLYGFFEDIFKRDNPYDTGRRRVLNRARLYRLGLQWIEEVDSGGDLWGTGDWQSIKDADSNAIPKPVQNELFPIITREAALLVKVGSRPYIRVDKDDPRVEMGAKLAKDVLLSTLEALDYEDAQRLGAMHSATYGVWGQVSYWDLDYTKTTRVPITTALKCPECDTTFAVPDLEEAQAQLIAAKAPDAVAQHTLQSPNSLIEEETRYRIRSCPTCEDHEEMTPSTERAQQAYEPPGGQQSVDGTPINVPPSEPSRLPGGPELVPYIPTTDEAKNAKDFVGRPLGQEVPIGDVAIEIMSPFDMRPNPSCQGINTTASNWEEFAWECARSLDWIRARYPQNGWKVKAEDSSEIFRSHPILGGLGAGGVTIGGPQIFKEHALIRTFAKKPYMVKDEQTGEVTRNKGRFVVMARNVVLMDSDYEIESQTQPGTYVPRIHFDWATWELRDLEWWGIGMPEIGFSQQDVVNTSLSQILDITHHWGSPRLLVEDGVDMSYVGGGASGYPSDYVYWKKSGNAGAPVPMGNTAPNQGMWTLKANQEEALQRSLMTRDIEGGAPQGGVTAYSALLLLANKAAEGRVPRVERIRAMKRRTYKHVLQLIHEFYREPRLMRCRGRNDKWEVKSFKGLQLMGQCDVIFEDEPIIDRGVAAREGIQQGLQAGSLNLSSSLAKRRFNRIMEIPQDINEDENLQVDIAEKESMAWIDDGKEPHIDPDLDSHPIHWDQHAEDLISEEWSKLKEACDWGARVFDLWGWKDELRSLEEAEAQFKVKPPVAPVEEKQFLDPGAYQQELQQYQLNVQIQQRLQGMPKPIELRIMFVWTMMLKKAGFDGAALSPETQQAHGKVMRFEAHAAGHRWLTQEQAITPEAQPPAPGEPGTDAGAGEGPAGAPEAEPEPAPVGA